MKRFSNTWELSIKDVQVRKERGFVQCRHVVDKGDLQMRTSVFFGLGFLDIYVMSAWTRGD